MIPFISVGIANIIAAYILYYAPQRPVSILLGPPIRRLFGEKFLHYPFNFYILPQLFGYAELVVNAFLGIFMTAIAVSMVADALKGHEASFLISFIRAIKRYFALVVTWALMFGAVYFASKYLPRILHTSDPNKLLLVKNMRFLATVFVQVLFIYIVPSMIVKNKNIFSAIKNNFVFLIRFFFPTVFLGLVPALLYVPVVVLKSKTAELVNTFFPEVVLGVVVVGIIASVAVEAIVTTSIAVLYVNKEVK
jgi:hypothetical protein